TRETGVPLSIAGTRDRQCLDFTLDQTVENDLQVTDLREVQLVAQFKTELFEGHTVVSSLTTKARIADFFFTRFRPPKECFEGQINPFLRILKYLRKHSFEFGVFGFPDWEQFIGVIQAQRFAPFLPCLFADCQRFIVDKAAQLKLVLKLVLLSRRRVET